MTEMQSKIAIVMGVTGSGKSTVGRRLAESLGWRFYDGDDFHSPANIDKMRRGIGLTDEDRGPWLDQLRAKIDETLQANQHAVIACSALRQTYRDHLLPLNKTPIKLIYLRISPELARARVEARTTHFMPTTLVDSQFATLEEPVESADGVIVLDGAAPLETLVAEIVHRLR